MKKVIIIGAGLGGLVSAIKLKHHGYDVTVIEKNGHIGGKINQFEKDGFTFDMGPNILMFHEMVDEVFEYVGKDPREYFGKIPLNNSYHIYFSNADKTNVSTDLVELSKHLEGINEKESLDYFSFLDGLYEHYTEINEDFLKKKLKTILDTFNPKKQGNNFKNKRITSNLNDSEVEKHEQLRKFLTFHYLFLDGSSSLGNSEKSLTSKLERLNNLWFFKGGMSAYIQGLEILMHEMGIKILTHTHVDEIFVTNGQAKGVVIGEDIFCADIVISNTDFPYAMKNLIKSEKHRPLYPNKKLEKMNYSPSAFMMVLGLDIKLNHLNVHNLYLTSAFDENIRNIFNSTLPTSPSMMLHVPSKIDSNLAPLNHEVLIILVPVPNLKDFNQVWNDNLIQQFRQIVMDRIASENLIENLEDHIVSETILTPKDWESSVHAHYGSIFGIAPTLKQSKHLKTQPKNKDIQHLYHTASFIYPGTGISSVIMSAQRCVDEVLKYDPNGEGNACSIYAKQYENA